jgi:DNA polymerase-1
MTISRDKTLLLIDSHALIYRAYYAMPASLTTSSGEPINAVYGFTSLLLDVLLKFKPANVIAVMDSKEATFRTEMFVEYKANRKPADELFIAQLPRVADVLKAFDIPLLKIPGFEADDIIATIDDKYSGQWAQTVIVTGDKDLFQLVDDDTFVYLAGSKFSASKLYDEVAVREKIGVEPKQIIDLKAIAGDPSDNIPGVRGIGSKGALDLVSKLESVENIYDNLDKVDNRYKSKLLESSEIAFLSKKLATVQKEVPISFDFTTSEFKKFNYQEASNLFDDLQFRSLKIKLKALADNMNLSLEENINDGQLGLLSDSDIAKVGLDVKSWDGKELQDKEIYFLPEFQDPNASPKRLKFQKGYFCYSGDSNSVFEVAEEQFIKFITALKGKKLYTFNIKKIFCCLDDQGLNALGFEYEDLNIISVVIAAGNVGNNLESALRFFGINVSENITENVCKLKDAFIACQRDSEKYSWASRVISLEKRILPLVIEMEQNGIILDVGMIKIFEQNLGLLKVNLQKSIFSDVGHEFNINSPKQVSEVLFVEKSLPGGRKTKSGGYSTDERQLKKLKGVDPVIDNLLKYREVDKLLSTYIKALPGYVDNFTKRVHATFDQLGAVSGRFSSRNPNLQNIPTPDGFDINVRSVFKSAPGNVFIAFDYSQQELRILAAFSNEEKMKDKFNNDADIHAATASELFEVPINEVTKHQRNVGKTVNFSVVYGISSFGLSERLEIPRGEAGIFIHKYFAEYPNVKKYFETVLSKAKEFGYVETILGRRRDVGGLISDNHILRQNTEREAINFGIQGSAADLMKLSMAKFKEVLDKYPVKLLLQIHDEFLFEFETKSEKNPQEDKNLVNFVKEICLIMSDVYDIGVKYKVDVKWGTNWGEMSKFEYS